MYFSNSPIEPETSRIATITAHAPKAAVESTPAAIEAAGTAWWPLQFACELDDLILNLRTNEFEIGTWVIKTSGDANKVMAADAVLETQTENLALQRRIATDMRDIWAMQPRFERRAGRAPYKLLEHPRFRAGYDFLLLRCESGELDMEIGDWWTDFYAAEGGDREEGAGALEPAPRIALEAGVGGHRGHGEGVQGLE